MPTAMVTGSSRGLGEAYARELGERGYSIVLVARDAARLAAAAERVGRATGAIVETMVADLTDDRDLARVERRVTDERLPIELLVNNAGVECDQIFAEAPVDGLTTEVELNVTALLRLTRAAVPAMTARGRGGILNVASMAGYLPSGGNAYGASKSWVLAFTDTVAASLHGTGVQVTAVVAGRVRGDADPTGPLWLEPETVVRRSLEDLRRGRTLSAPGWVYRALVGYLESPRTALRAVAKVAGRGRERCRRLERGRAGADVHTRPSPVPGPFHGAPPARALPAGAGSLPALPGLPPRPAHVPAKPLPRPRTTGTGPLPAVPAGPGVGVTPRPVQPPRVTGRADTGTDTVRRPTGRPSAGTGREFRIRRNGQT
ncbi:SDR family NAD(P)-dependent oxidoreductase [Pseudonocardia nantongensis]|uniref:SDR family NAD(P)-dependent oxidoreductase n=1 Tax=Pseudonocardia nantongensis TaxID=1181885 RepID=UPI0039795862